MITLQPEVRAFVEACENLITFVIQGHSVSTDEADLIQIYLKELSEKVWPVLQIPV